jgi:5,10-methylenetetrahydromethanopterin reductase
MKFGVLLAPDNLTLLRQRAQLAEAVGFDYIGIGDSQSLFRELYVSLSVIALATSQVRIGPTVTNPLTRHPAVTASAIASLNELSSGRAFLGISTGDSAVHNLELQPARLAYLKEYIQAVHALLAGQTHVYQGHRIHVRWAQDQVPVLMAAEGPRTLRLAGEVADAVLVHTGLTPEMLQESIARIRDGERAAGKPEGSVAVWAYARCNIADRREDAVDELKPALAGSGHHAFGGTLEGKHVPEALKEAVRTLQREYVTAEHLQPGQNRNATLADGLGLTEFLAERFAVVGTPEDCIKKVQVIQLAGPEVLHITAIGPHPERIIERFGREVIAKLTSD